MILDLKATHGFTAADVAAIDCLVGIANARNLAYPEPNDEMQARFSMHYCVAVALLQDHLGLADFTASAVARPEARALLGLTTMRSREAAEERAAGGRRLPHQVAVTLKDGTVLRAERLAAKGAITDPFSDADRRAKFIDCCAIRHGAATTDALYAALQRLDDQPDLACLAPAFG
jgi:2-methylcitrate dehydratase PrpD